MKTSWLFFKKYILSKNSNSTTRRISFLCFLGISVSVLAITVIVSVMNGFGDAIESRMLNFEPHLIVSAGTPSQLKVLQQKIQSDDVRSYLFYQDQVIVRTSEGQYSGAIARGLEGESLQQFIQASRQIQQSRVKRLSWGEKVESPLILGDEDVVIGSDLAYQLGVFIGDQIVMTPPETLLLPQGEIPSTSRRVIQDVIRTGVQSLDGQFILYTKDKGSLFKDSVSHEVLLEVYLTHPKLLDEVLKKIPAGYKVETWRERNSALFYSLKMEKNLITFFLLLSILVGSFSIVTILILLATQKRQEIAVLLTLGLSQRRISKMFTHIGFFISSLGVFVGFFLGLVVCLFLDSTTLIQLPDIYYDRSLPVKFVPEFYMLVLVLSLLIALFSSNLPARWFLRFTPQDILRKNFKS